MTRIEYIRLSHRRTNRKIRERLQAVRTRLDAKSRWLGGAWQAVAWVLYSIVSVVSWLAFAAEMFKDNRFSLHNMECEIEHRNLSAAEARQYIADKKQEYDRWLAYGSISVKEQRRIDKTFEYLFARYPADTPADELLTHITEVRSTVTEIADYTRHRQTEETQHKEREAELLAQAEKRRTAQRSRTGFDPTPADFCPRLTNRQIAVLTEHVNRIGIFKRDTTEAEIARLLACQLSEPLQTTHYITRRIDRGAHGEKYPMEDLCQLSERLTEHKYKGSYEQIAKMILRYSSVPKLDVVNFWEQVLFSWLTGNADMHLKNFSLYSRNPGVYGLTPAYDLLSTALVLPEDTEELALTLNGRKRKLCRNDFVQAMTASGLDEKVIDNLFKKFIKAIPKWGEWIDISFLPEEMKGKYKALIAERIGRI